MGEGWRERIVWCLSGLAGLIFQLDEAEQHLHSVASFQTCQGWRAEDREGKSYNVSSGRVGLALLSFSRLKSCVVLHRRPLVSETLVHKARFSNAEVLQAICR